MKLADHPLYEKYGNYFLSLITVEDINRRYEMADICAKMAVVLSDFELIEEILGLLEKDIKTEWLKIEKSHNLKVLDPSGSTIELLGCRWPLPNENLVSDHFDQLLHKVLLKNEQNNHVNEPNPSEGINGIVTFVGLVADDVVAKTLSKYQVWREETRIAPLLFHGKDSHRIQLAMIFYALKYHPEWFEGTNIDSHKIIDMLNTYPEDRPVLFTFVLDLVVVGIDQDTFSSSFYKPHPLLENKTLEELQENIKLNKIAFFSDPLYVNNYLMNSGNKFPYLNSCVISSFCKSVHKLFLLENNLGYTIGVDGKLFEIKNNYTVKDTLVIQGSTSRHHPINPEVLAHYYYQSGAVEKPIPTKTTWSGLTNIKWKIGLNEQRVDYSDIKGFAFFKSKACTYHQISFFNDVIANSNIGDKAKRVMQNNIEDFFDLIDNNIITVNDFYSLKEKDAVFPVDINIGIIIKSIKQFGANSLQNVLAGGFSFYELCTCKNTEKLECLLKNNLRISQVINKNSYFHNHPVQDLLSLEPCFLEFYILYSEVVSFESLRSLNDKSSTNISLNIQFIIQSHEKNTNALKDLLEAGFQFHELADCKDIFPLLHFSEKIKAYYQSQTDKKTPIRNLFSYDIGQILEVLRDSSDTARVGLTK